MPQTQPPLIAATNLQNHLDLVRVAFGLLKTLELGAVVKQGLGDTWLLRVGRWRWCYIHPNWHRSHPKRGQHASLSQPLSTTPLRTACSAPYRTPTERRTTILVSPDCTRCVCKACAVGMDRLGQARIKDSHSQSHHQQKMAASDGKYANLTPLWLYIVLYI